MWYVALDGIDVATMQQSVWYLPVTPQFYGGDSWNATSQPLGERLGGLQTISEVSATPLGVAIHAHQSPTPGIAMSARRSRASVACEKCRQRKVRCSISLTGVPCVSCTQDGSVCSVRPTKTNISGPLRRDTTPQSPAGNITRPTNGTAPIQYSNQATTTTYTSPNDHSHVRGISSLDSNSNNVHEPSEEHTGAQIVTAAIEQNDESNDLPFYIGMKTCSNSGP